MILTLYVFLIGFLLSLAWTAVSSLGGAAYVGLVLWG
jgi:hypothetical protein